jgi:predicted secreted hydrolase
LAEDEDEMSMFIRTRFRVIARHVPLVALCLFVGLPPMGARAERAAYNRVELPRDAAMHAGAGTEWWYFTGHLRDGRGNSYGFELVTFKFQGLKKVDPYSPFDLGYRTDIAITDEAHRMFYSAVTYLPPKPGTTGIGAGVLKIRMPSSSSTMMVDTLSGPGLRYRLRGSIAGGSLDLRINTARPPLLEGGAGVVPMGSSGFSYYYSLTNMTTTGTLTLGGRHLSVTGMTWMDHQWGSWKWSGIKGWDWMGVQLSNGTSLVLSNFAAAKLSLKSATISFPSGAQLITTNSTMAPLNRFWLSPVTRTRYPQGWHVQVPAIGLDAVVTPTIPNQEVVDPLSLGPTYWEGSCRLTGTLKGKPITGQTYTELVGYGKRSAIEM